MSWGNMQKRKPHHDLDAFKKAFLSVGRTRITRSALRGSRALGLSLAGMAEVVLSMSREQFYKSMTSKGDHTRWQDVYHVPWRGILLYVKLTEDRLTDFLLLSFKEK